MPGENGAGRDCLTTLLLLGLLLRCQDHESRPPPLENEILWYEEVERVSLLGRLDFFRQIRQIRQLR